jgi:hypothetical protein
MEIEAAHIHAAARELLEQQGAQAIVIAAQRAVMCEREHKADAARTWRRIEAALMQLRGPRQT